MSIWNHAEYIDAVPEAARVTLGEGNTPLIRSRRIGPSIGLGNLFFKLEFANPTASFKDRFAAAAISHMVAAGQRRCVATSSGNTGSSLAAYCAAAGIECVIALVEAAPEGKLQQMRSYGAQLFKIHGFGRDVAITQKVMDTIRKKGSEPGAAVQVSSYIYSPQGMTGVQGLAPELAEQIAADHVFCPAGGGGLAVAVARGYALMMQKKLIAVSPRIEVVQPEGNDTIASALREGSSEARAVTSTTKISGLQVPTVNDGHLVVRECRATGGSGHVVTDDEVWQAQRRLAREEGIFTEPAGATALAGALRAVREGRLAPDATVVCLVTGSGFKDPASVERMVGEAAPLVELEEFQRRL